MIKFVTGYSGYGGSTIMLIQHCNLLNENGIVAEIYGPQDWHFARCKSSRMLHELVPEEDDILIYHFSEPTSRPKCKKLFLFLQETSLYDLKTKPVDIFDEVLFVSKEQRMWHGRNDGKIVPNRVNGLVDPLLHNPPSKNIAGIVGNIHPIKNPDVSIAKAIEDGRDEIILFGPIMDGMAFEDYLSNYVSKYDARVKYGGFIEPENRMDMYNSFDVLYHFGEYESACITLGECRLLGKEVVKGDKLHDYPILNDQDIFNVWKKLIEE
jgi:glycosyltransferase involved in cell wall biosynthesis